MQTKIQSSSDSGIIDKQLLNVDLTKKLGQGGFGVVYKGKYRGIDAAVKELLVQEFSQKAQTEFELEARIMLQLRDPSVVHLYGVTNEKPYRMVLEFCELGSLDKYLQKREASQVSWALRFHLSMGIASGLHYLHSYNPVIIHGDLKSLNVLLTGNPVYPKLKLGDFGMARLKTEVQTKSKVTYEGTLQWAAPELFALNGKKTASSDMYAFAMTMWEIATHEYPYPGCSQVAIREAVKGGDRAEIPEGTPALFQQVMKACWVQELKNRPSAATALSQLQTYEGLGELESVGSEGSGSQTSSPKPSGFLNSSNSPVVSQGSAVSPSGKGQLMATSRRVTAPIFQSSFSSSTSKSTSAGEGETLPSDYAVPHLEGKTTPKPAIAVGVQLQQAYQAILQGNISEAFKLLEMLVQTEQPIAYALFGLLHEELLEPTNKDMAMVWYKKAQALCVNLVSQMQEGNLLARCALAILGFHYPSGATQRDEAFTYYLQMIAEGDVFAAYEIGRFFQEVPEVTLHDGSISPGPVEAVKAYTQAINGGFAPAGYKLGLCYEQGQGVTKNLEKAFECYKNSAIRGYAPAENSVGTCYETAQGVKQDIPAAIEWYGKAAAKGFLLAQHNLGVLYENGRPGVLANLVKAAQYYTAAAMKGFARSQNNLAKFYETGQGGIPVNPTQAAQLYQLAANQSYARAQYNLAVCYEQGRGVEKDVAQAKHYYTLAAQANERISPTAQQSLQKLLQMYPQLQGSSTASPPTPFWSLPNAARGIGRGAPFQQVDSQMGKPPAPF